MEDFGAVSCRDWRIAECVESKRRNRLEDPPSAKELIGLVRKECEAAAANGRICLIWQTSCDQADYARIECKIPLSDELFDQFFNGRTGYRAQYYVSPICGTAFNGLVIQALHDAIKVAYDGKPLDQDFEVVKRSLLGSWSKCWVVGDGEAFAAAPAALLAPRWVENWKDYCSKFGLRIPAPNQPQLDLKGTFIHSANNGEWVDPLKICRSFDIYFKGWT